MNKWLKIPLLAVCGVGIMVGASLLTTFLLNHYEQLHGREATMRMIGVLFGAFLLTLLCVVIGEIIGITMRKKQKLVSEKRVKMLRIGCFVAWLLPPIGCMLAGFILTYYRRPNSMRAYGGLCLLLSFINGLLGVYSRF